jgi:hypothetical protein
MDGHDVDLGLLAKVKIVRQAIERDLDPALPVDSVAFRLDSGNQPLKPLGRQRSQNDLDRFADADLPGLAFVDVGEQTGP